MRNYRVGIGSLSQTVIRAGSKGFEPRSSHVKFSCRFASLSQTMVRAGSIGLNHPELLLHMIASHEFGVVQHL